MLKNSHETDTKTQLLKMNNSHDENETEHTSQTSI